MLRERLKAVTDENKSLKVECTSSTCVSTCTYTRNMEVDTCVCISKVNLLLAFTVNMCVLCTCTCMYVYGVNSPLLCVHVA